MFYMVVARLAAVTHLSFIVFLIVGGPLGRRHRGLIGWHLATIAATLAINLGGLPCPLTDLEKWALRRAGRVPYQHGFISHYLVEPIHPAGITGRVNLVLLCVWVIPTTLAYLPWHRRRPAADCESERKDRSGS